MSVSIRDALTAAQSALSGPERLEDGPAFSRHRMLALGALLGLLAEDADRAARNLVEENRALRGLFAEAAEGGWAPGLLSRLRELARSEDADFALSTLEASNAELKKTLALLHEAVEAGRSAAGKARERRILRLLKERAAASRLEPPWAAP